MERFRHKLVKALLGREKISPRLVEIMRNWVHPGFSVFQGEASRAAGRFAMVAAAGETGIEAGIFPWPEDAAIEASAGHFKEWLSGRGTSGAMDTEAAIRQVTDRTPPGQDISLTNSGDFSRNRC